MFLVCCLRAGMEDDQSIVTKSPLHLLLSTNIRVSPGFLGPVCLDGQTVVALLGFVWLSDAAAVCLAAVLVGGLVLPLRRRFDVGGPGRLVVAVTHCGGNEKDW
jgi:hypothetical protein